jgi:hypothetical protein
LALAYRKVTPSGYGFVSLLCRVFNLTPRVLVPLDNVALAGRN